MSMLLGLSKEDKSAERTVFKSFELLVDSPLKIECVELWTDKQGPKIFAGTDKGIIAIYALKDSKVQLLSSINFSKKPINQITAFPDKPYLLSLSAETVTIHTLPSCDVFTQIAKAKGASLYAVDVTRNPSSLCIAVKKKVIYYTLTDGFDLVEVKEINLPDIPKTMTVSGTTLCVGIRKGYCLVNLVTGLTSDLFESKANLWATSLPGDQVMLGKDTMGVFYNFEGKLTHKFGVNWMETPTSVAYWHPYTVAVLSRVVEVRTHLSVSPSAIQRLSLSKARLVTVTGDYVIVASPTNIWLLAPVPLIEQIDEMLRKKEFEQALLFCESFPDNHDMKIKKLQEVRCYHAYYLFNQGHYARALKVFEEIKTNPIQVIALYPNVLPADRRDKTAHPVDIPKLSGAPLETALEALIEYLLAIRADPSYSATFLGIIDTCLIKVCVLLNKDELASKILMSSNNCNIEECEKMLSENQKHKEQCLLYKSKGRHKDALKLLAKLGQTKNSPLSGPTPSINYLRELSGKYVQLIFEYSKWVLNTAGEVALEIFTRKRETEEDELPRGEVLVFLKQAAPHLIVPYLENVINGDAKEERPDFHNELISKYLDLIKSASSNSKDESFAHSVHRVRVKLLDFLKNSNFYSAEKILSRMLQEASFSGLYEEQAILFSRIGQHENALSIYAYGLKNFKMAEKYCQDHYSSKESDVYLALLKVYLNPPPDTPVNEVAVASILNNYHTFMDSMKVIELLPPAISVSRLGKFLETVFLQVAHRRKDMQIMRSLLLARSLKMKEDLAKARSPMVRIQEDTICGVCNKRLLTSVFACYPNKVVVHLGCAKDKYVCPVTGQNFKPDVQKDDGYGYS